MSTNRVNKVAIVGVGDKATGNLGAQFTEKLLAAGRFTITALVRSESKAVLPAGVRKAAVSYTDEASLIEALRGHDFLIITLSTRAAKDAHTQIVQAAAKAGIRYVMPNVYGHDVTHAGLRADDFYCGAAAQRAQDVRDAGMKAVVMVCGFWYATSLSMGTDFLGIDIRARRAVLFDDGKQRTNLTTFAQCARALAAVLCLPLVSEGGPCVHDFVRRPLYVSSFRVNQRDMLDSVFRVTGSSGADWIFVKQNARERHAKAAAELHAAFSVPVFARAMYTRSFFDDAAGDFEGRLGTANNILGVPAEEDFDAETREAVRRALAGETY